MIMIKKKEIFVIAGEPSGDQHAARYVEEHKKLNSDLIFNSFGQKKLREVSTNLIYDTEKISVVGIIEVISKYREIVNALKAAKNHIKANKPELVILVDYVEFNLKVAKYAKSLNIPVIFYIAPQLWAWRERRAKALVENIKHLAVIFPFEEVFFKKHTNNVSYVGHPLFQDSFLLNSTVDYSKRDIDLGIFPGSRESEIRNNIFLMLDCIQKNKKEKIAIFYANESSYKLLQKLLPDEYHSKLKSGADINKVANCKKALCASGTITLELSILEVPMIIMYKLSFITYFIMKSMVKIKHIGLVNLVLGREIGDEPIVKEYIQPSYSDQIEVMVELNKIDNESQYRESIINKYREIKNKLSVVPNKKLQDIVEDILKST